MDRAVRVPLFQFRGEDAVFGSAAAVEQHDPAIMVAVLQHRIDDRSQRRDPDAAGDNDHVFPFHGLQRPAASEGAAQPDQCAGT